MSEDFLSPEGAKRLVGDYMGGGDSITSTQDILNSGEIPRLSGYIVKPGKVSDSIFGGFEGNPPLETRDGIPLRLMVRTQKISTHDIGRGEIPFKDQILAANHNYMRRLLIDVLGTSQFEVDGLGDDSVVVAAENLKQIPYENVLRAFMAKSSTSTSLYQHFMTKEREFCGHKLPDDLIANGALPYIMDTPSTKSEEHDESVTPETLIKMGVCNSDQYREIRNSSIFAFGVVSNFLKHRGLIAVDTKTEHGINRNGKIVSQDEIWTMDSSRFWELRNYNDQLAQLASGEIDELAPKSFSKEFARGISRGDEGYSDEERAQIACRYIEGIQRLLGTKFRPDLQSSEIRIISGLETAIDQLGVKSN